MKNIKSRISMFLVGVLAVTGVFTFIGGVATPDQADAATQYNCWRVNDYQISCYIDYNWYEESWWGGFKKDGRYLIFSPLIYGYR